MKAAATRVQLTACDCSRRPRPVDLDALSARLGEDADLWDRRVRCEICGKLRHYLAAGGEGTPFLPLITNGREVRWPPDVAAARARKARLRSMGLTPRDVIRLKRLAEACQPTQVPAGLDDLDVPYRVQALPPDMAARSSGTLIGHWAGRCLVCWPLLDRALERWERRPKGPRRLP